MQRTLAALAVVAVVVLAGSCAAGQGRAGERRAAARGAFEARQRVTSTPGGMVVVPLPQGRQVKPMPEWVGETARASKYSMSTEGAGPTFTVADPGKEMKWIIDLSESVDWRKFPYVRLTYRATDVRRERSGYVLWLFDGRPMHYGGFEAVLPVEIVSDGKPHTIDVNLRRFNPAGPITMLMLRVASAKTGRPAVLDVERIEFVQGFLAVDTPSETGGIRPPMERLDITFANPADAREWKDLHAVSVPTVVDRELRFEVTGRDPYLHIENLRIPAGSVQCVIVRMKKDRGTRGQIFWMTSDMRKFTDAAHMDYATVADGRFHDIIPVGQHPMWKGAITAIRIDPDTTAGRAQVAIRYIKSADIAAADAPARPLQDVPDER